MTDEKMTTEEAMKAAGFINWNQFTSDGFDIAEFMKGKN